MSCKRRDSKANSLSLSTTYSRVLISRNLGDINKLLADIQKKWLESCFEKLKSLKDRNVYEVVGLPKR